MSGSAPFKPRGSIRAARLVSARADGTWERTGGNHKGMKIISLESSWFDISCSYQTYKFVSGFNSYDHETRGQREELHRNLN